MSTSNFLNGVYGLDASLKPPADPLGTCAWYDRKVKVLSDGNGYLFVDKAEVLKGLDWKVFAWQLGPLEVSGAVSGGGLLPDAVEFKVSLNLPIAGKVDIASASGSLKHGVRADFNIPPIAQGYVRLYMEHNDGGLFIEVFLESALGNIERKVVRLLDR